MSEQPTKDVRLWHRDVPARVTEYLGAGGLFNPELMDHEAVRHILIDARDVIEIVAREKEDAELIAAIVAVMKEYRRV